jgi:CheY-like chemotaxis protein
MHMPDQPIYSIGAVASMIHVPRATLRTWEERYGVVRPSRSAGGHRLYSRADVERLRLFAERVHEGMSPGDAHRLQDAAQRAPTVSPRTDPEGSILILLAERDPFAAEFAEFFLKTEGFQVTLALDITDAERALEQRLPQIAIIDLLLSGGAGLEFCRSVRQAGVLVLAISSLQSREEAIEAGASAFLQKPLAPLQLVSAIKDLLGKSAYLRESTSVR